MPLNVGDYLADTGHLTTTQHGAYLLLLMHYWRKRELPNDDKQLAAIAKLPIRIWLDSKETIQAFFFEGWRHKRVEAELAKRAEVSERRAEAGARGGARAQMNRFIAVSNSQPIGKQLLHRTPKQSSSKQVANASILLPVCSSMTHTQENITTTDRVERGEGLGDGSVTLSPEALAAIVAKR